MQRAAVLFPSPAASDFSVKGGLRWSVLGFLGAGSARGWLWSLSTDTRAVGVPRGIGHVAARQTSLTPAGRLRTLHGPKARLAETHRRQQLATSLVHPL